MSKEIPIPGTLVSSDEVDLSKYSIPIEDTEIWKEIQLKIIQTLEYSPFRNSNMLSILLVNELQKHYTITRKK